MKLSAFRKSSKSSPSPSQAAAPSRRRNVSSILRSKSAPKSILKSKPKPAASASTSSSKPAKTATAVSSPPPPLISPPAPAPPIRVNVVLLGDENIGKRPILRAIGGYRHVTTQHIREGPIFFRRHYVKRVDEFRGIRFSIGSTSSSSAHPISIPPYMAKETNGDNDTSNTNDTNTNTNTNAGTGVRAGMQNGRDVRVDLSVRPLDERIMGLNYNGHNHFYFQTIFKDAQAIALCYRVGKVNTLRDIMNKWFPIVTFFAHELHLPIVLIGIQPREPVKPFRPVRHCYTRSLSLSTPTGYATLTVPPPSTPTQPWHPNRAPTEITTASIPINQSTTTATDRTLGQRSQSQSIPSITVTPSPPTYANLDFTNSPVQIPTMTLSEPTVEWVSSSPGPSGPSQSSNQEGSSSSTAVQETQEKPVSSETAKKTEEQKEKEELVAISRRLNAVCVLQCGASDSDSVRNVFRSVGWIGYHYDLKSRSFRPPSVPDHTTGEEVASKQHPKLKRLFSLPDFFKA